MTEAALLLFLLPSVATAEPPLTVCEVLSNLKVYHGQTISVRGELEEALEWISLKPHGCTVKVRIEDRDWPPAIFVTFPGTQEAKHVDFEVDRGSFATMRKAFAGDDIAGKRRIHIATFVGMLQSKLTVVPFGPGRRGVIGYGHLGAFAAMLVVKTVKDPVVIVVDEATPKSKYKW